MKSPCFSSYYTWLKGTCLRCPAFDKFHTKEMFIICLIKKQLLGRVLLNFLDSFLDAQTSIPAPKVPWIWHYCWKLCHTTKIETWNWWVEWSKSRNRGTVYAFFILCLFKTVWILQVLRSVIFTVETTQRWIRSTAVLHKMVMF